MDSTFENEAQVKPTKHGIVTKYSAFVDKLIVIISIWVSLSMVAKYTNELPDLNWPYHGEQLLYVLLTFTLVYVTLRFLRLFVFFGVLIGLVYLLSVVFIDVYEDTRDPRKTEQTKIIKTLNENNTLLLPKPVNVNYPSDSLELRIEQLEHKVLLMEQELILSKQARLTE
ncbi:hypothetical protein FSS13T_15770 [Flavobacterium saliperosum S13]|uniref:Uncharacterized protein n=2 Tax=Flavobacterium saliperosum TaxID=329186 RepID=A0A1G4VGP6_9FLAO|nr:hypothetical protein [Flavobacterium saliperosum]ESU25625.1 hypothetical protein FSS13T_15770 [Flavobacterium saliperosum S13]SCX06526.1 hypothetical protein SAMN02927925_01016 [Flavobacterium saliperosum]